MGWAPGSWVGVGAGLTVTTPPLSPAWLDHVMVSRIRSAGPRQGSHKPQGSELGPRIPIRTAFLTWPGRLGGETPEG